MRSVAKILAGLTKALRRGAKSTGSFTSNHLFLVSVTLLFFKDPGAFVSLNALIAVVLFFPLSADPLRKIPAVRLAIWPLGSGDRALLRFLAIWLNPIPWVLAVLAIRRTVTRELWMLVAVLFSTTFLAPLLPVGRGRGLFLRLPHFPGPLDQLIRKDLRQTFSSLDFWCAVLVSAASLGFRCAGLLPEAALLPLTGVVMLALSTATGNLFGMDGDAGMTRYRLLPLAGWQILAAKDAAFLLIALALSIPLSPLAALAAALTALAFGRYASVHRRHLETRWRFRTASSAGAGLLQVVLMLLAAAGVVNGSPLLLIPCLAAYAWATRHWGAAPCLTA